MTPNDVLRSLRYILNVRDEKIREILELGQGRASLADIEAYLRSEEEPGFAPCTDEVLSRFLNGLILFKRGSDPARPPMPVERRMTNNTVMKKLRVAFELKDTDLIRLIEKQGTLKVSKSELGAFFRAPDHRNYRDCGDQYLRNLLKGLAG
jgi:uncharacterized protein YehS (DUF1456 family)